MAKYVLKKGYIAVDGCSLTIGDVNKNLFSIHLIPETLNRTLFGRRQVGEAVNIEFDPQTQAIVDTVERLLDGNTSSFRKETNDPTEPSASSIR